MSVFPPDQGNRNKNKNKQMGPNQTYMLLHSKGNHKQHEKTTNRMGENNCKWCDQQRINFQNIQITHTTKQWETNNPIEKWAEDLFLQRRNTDSQQTCEKMLSIANYKDMQIKTTIMAQDCQVKIPYQAGHSKGLEVTPPRSWARADRSLCTMTPYCPEV